MTAAQSPTAQIPGKCSDFQGGIDDHAPLVQFKRRVLEYRARRNASSPDQDVRRHCFPIATVDCTVGVRENSGVELDLNLPLPEFLLGIETKRFAQFRKDHRSAMDQDDPQLAGINPAVVREDVTAGVIARYDDKLLQDWPAPQSLCLRSSLPAMRTGHERQSQRCWPLRALRKLLRVYRPCSRYIAALPDELKPWLRLEATPDWAS